MCPAYFLSPRPTPEQLTRIYNDSYYGVGETKFPAFLEKALDRFRSGRAQRLARLLGRRGRVLDIGCGNGAFLGYLQQMGEFEIHGIEREGPAAGRAGLVPDLNLKVGALSLEDHSPESFDAVTLFHAFEHLPNPVGCMDTIDIFLKPNGILVMSFPNISSIQSRIFKGDWLHLDPPRHLFLVPPSSFRRIMRGRGYKVLKERHFSLEYNPFGMQQSLLNLFCKRREVLFEHLKGNRAYVQDYSRRSLLLQELFCVATLPGFVLFEGLVSLFRHGATVEFVLQKK